MSCKIGHFVGGCRRPPVQVVRDGPKLVKVGRTTHVILLIGFQSLGVAMIVESLTIGPEIALGGNGLSIHC